MWSIDVENPAFVDPFSTEKLWVFPMSFSIQGTLIFNGWFQGKSQKKPLELMLKTMVFPIDFHLNQFIVIDLDGRLDL